jgi:hypothetical protein
LVAGVAAIVAVTSTASAAVISFTSFSIWNNYAVGSGASVLTETFDGISNGFYPSPFSGSVGGINWTALASGGLYVQGGQFSTNNPEALTFNVSPGVQGIGGNLYGTDINFNVVPSIVQVTLNDGSSYIGFQGASTDFVGFYSTGAAISSISISAMPGMPGGGDVYPTANNLYFAAVPAPGAIALLGLAGLSARRRSRN